MFPTIPESDEQKSFSAPGTNARAATLTKVKDLSHLPRPQRHPPTRIIVSVFRVRSIPCLHRDPHRRKIHVLLWCIQRWSKPVRII